MGDVAMTVPVISSLVAQQDVQVVLLTTRANALLFSGISNVRVFIIDKEGRHNGALGLFRLFLELKKEKIDAVADLHDVIRSQFLRLMFSVNGVKTATINKGRAEKKALTKFGKDKNVALKTTIERYQDVFKQLGFQFDLSFNSIFTTKPSLLPLFVESFGKKNEKWIGIAPFAKHIGKIYPLQKMEEVLALLDKHGGVKVFLFGNGTQENKIMFDWQQKYGSINLIPNKTDLTEELNLMANLDLMLSMDSANMHLASLVGLPVVSVWGATHYYAGFLGWNQLVENIVELDLDCRPCSIYGNKSCRRKDYACLNQLDPTLIYQKITNLISK